MADIQPFRGLRYDPAIVRGDEVIAPPYDVVSPQQVAALLERSPHNIALVESAPGDPVTRFEAAAKALRDWEAAGVLRRDPGPGYYIYEQRFTVLGERMTRRAFFARLRLSPPDAGIVRPHEATLSAPKAERLSLQRATRANVSPIFVMFPDPSGHARDLIATATAATTPDFTATDALGDEHRLWAISDRGRIAMLTKAVAAGHVTIADGHHRYATALNYLAERGGDALPANAPERWVLAGMVPEEEPGLVVLPIHRMVHGDVPSDLLARLSTLYEVSDLTPEPWDPAAVDALWARVRAGALGPSTFGLLGAGGRTLHLLTARSRAAIDAAMPTGRSAASRSLDVLVLTETVLAPVLSIDALTLASGGRVTFTEDHHEAWHAVERGECRIAFLVNATRVEQIVAVADAGEVMPQKSTFFYPKLATGMVINRLDD